MGKLHIPHWLKLMSVGAWPLTYKITLIFLVVSLLPMSILSYLSLQSSLAQVEQDQRQTLTLKAHSLSQQIDYLLDQHQRFAQSLAKDNDVIDYLKAQPSSYRDLQKRVDDDLSLLAKSLPDLSHVSILDRKGSFIATSRPELLGFSSEFRQYFKAAIAGQPHVSNLITGQRTKENGIFFAAPVYDTDQKTVLGVVIIKLKDAAIYTLFERSKLQEYTMQPFLVDDQGTVIYHHNTHYLYRNILDKSKQKYAVEAQIEIGKEQYFTQQGLEKGLSFQEPNSLDFQFNDQSYIAGVAPAKKNHWRVYVSKSYDDFALPIQMLFYKNIIILLLCTLGSVLLALVLRRTFVRPLSILIDQADKIKSGDYASSLVDKNLQAVSQRTDELGNFARIFSDMVSEVHHREYNLDLLVQKRTHELAEKNRLIAESYTRIDQELRLAHDMQQAILPQDFPDHQDFQVYAKMRPAKEMGGDFYDCFELTDGKYAVLVADVAGKGVASAFFMGVSSTVLKQAAALHQHPKDVLAYANHVLCQRNPTELFVTVFYGVFDTHTGVFEYASAGHPPAILKRDGGQMITLDIGYDLPIGAWEDTVYQQFYIQFESKDLLFIYSDGITEALSPSQEEFGEERLYQWLGEQNDHDVKVAFEHLKSTVTDFVGDAEPHDDMTSLILAWRNTMLKKAEWSILPEIEQITIVAEKVEQWLEPYLGQSELIFQINLCIDEILNNIIMHSEHPKEQPIKIELILDENIICCKVWDQGLKFNPFLEVKNADTDSDLADRPIGGLGIHLIKNLMDEYSYDRFEKYNIICMVKNINPHNEQTS